MCAPAKQHFEPEQTQSSPVTLGLLTQKLFLLSLKKSSQYTEHPCFDCFQLVEHPLNEEHQNNERNLREEV